MSIQENIQRLREDMRAEGIQPEAELGQELFLFASTLMPVVNVDLLVFNKKGEVLFAWRDDAHCGLGWHVPGGCMRLGETFSQRIQKTAQAELGVSVVHAAKPVGVFELFIREYRKGLADQRERSHFITLPFACRLPENYEIHVRAGQPIPGDLRWFSSVPDNMLSGQDCYKTDWEDIYNKAWRDYNGILEK